MKKFTVFFLLFFTVRIFSQTTPPESDFQIWNDTQIKVTLIKAKDKKTERLSIIFYGSLRSGINSTRLIDERIGVGFEFRVNKFLTVTPGYFYRAGQPFGNKKEYENRIRFDVGLEKKFKYFSLKDRHRIEHRIRNSRADSTRYRNKLQLSFPVNKDKKEFFAPFVATEPYYEFQSKHWTRNEFSAGISKKFSPNLTTEFYYTLQNNRGNTFKFVNIFGVNLKIKID